MPWGGSGGRPTVGAFESKHYDGRALLVEGFEAESELPPPDRQPEPVRRPAILEHNPEADGSDETDEETLVLMTERRREDEEDAVEDEGREVVLDELNGSERDGAPAPRTPSGSEAASFADRPVNPSARARCPPLLSSPVPSRSASYGLSTATSQTIVPVRSTSKTRLPFGSVTSVWTGGYY